MVDNRGEHRRLQKRPAKAYSNVDAGTRSVGLMGGRGNLLQMLHVVERVGSKMPSLYCESGERQAGSVQVGRQK